MTFISDVDELAKLLASHGEVANVVYELLQRVEALEKVAAPPIRAGVGVAASEARADDGSLTLAQRIVAANPAR